MNGCRMRPGVDDGTATAAAWTPPADGAPWIASIGHSDHALDAFFGLLTEHRVGTLVDVRSHPRSFVTHFSKANLAPECGKRGVAYHHLRGLGGLRDVPYPEHMTGQAWRSGYDRLRALAWQALHAGHRAAFLCVERDPAGCHRRFIAARLEADGWRVQHILPDTAQTRLF